MLAAVQDEGRPEGEFAVSVTDPLEIGSEDGTTIVATLYEPDADGERAAVSKIDDITTPTLTVSGWHDRLFWPNEALLNWRGIADNDVDSRLPVYDGGHDFEGAPSTPVQNSFISDAVLSWLDTHLRDSDGADDLARVSTYRAASDGFETGERFPPEGFERESFALGDAADAPVFTLGNGTHGAETLPFAFIVDGETGVAGVPRLSPPVTAAGGDADVFAGLERVDADGNATLLKDQVAAASPEDAETLDLDLVAVETTLAPGEALRLTLTLRDGALVDVPILGVNSDLFGESATSEYPFVGVDEDATLEAPVRRA